MATMAWPCQYINVKLELFTDLSLSSPLWCTRLLTTQQGTFYAFQIYECTTSS
jgi:hypothetical protein